MTEEEKVLRGLMEGQKIVSKISNSIIEFCKKTHTIELNCGLLISEEVHYPWSSLISRILEGEFKLYEEKPKLAWFVVDEVHTSRNYFIRQYKNTYLAIHSHQTCSYLDDTFIGSFNYLDEAKKACQEHFEENF